MSRKCISRAAIRLRPSVNQPQENVLRIVFKSNTIFQFSTKLPIPPRRTMELIKSGENNNPILDEILKMSNIEYSDSMIFDGTQIVSKIRSVWMFALLKKNVTLATDDNRLLVMPRKMIFKSSNQRILLTSSLNFKNCFLEFFFCFVSTKLSAKNALSWITESLKVRHYKLLSFLMIRAW